MDSNVSKMEGNEISSIFLQRNENQCGKKAQRAQKFSVLLSAEREKEMYICSFLYCSLCTCLLCEKTPTVGCCKQNIKQKMKNTHFPSMVLWLKKLDEKSVAAFVAC